MFLSLLKAHASSEPQWNFFSLLPLTSGESFYYLLLLLIFVDIVSIYFVKSFSTGIYLLSFPFLLSNPPDPSLPLVLRRWGRRRVSSFVSFCLSFFFITYLIFLLLSPPFFLFGSLIATVFPIQKLLFRLLTVCFSLFPFDCFPASAACWSLDLVLRLAPLGRPGLLLGLLPFVNHPVKCPC